MSEAEAPVYDRLNDLYNQRDVYQAKLKHIFEEIAEIEERRAKNADYVECPDCGRLCPKDDIMTSLVKGFYFCVDCSMSFVPPP